MLYLENIIDSREYHKFCRIVYKIPENIRDSRDYSIGDSRECYKIADTTEYSIKDSREYIINTREYYRF